MTATRFADLRNRLTNPKQYDAPREITARRETEAEANRAKYPTLARAIDSLRAVGINAYVEAGSIREVTK